MNLLLAEDLLNEIKEGNEALTQRRNTMVVWNSLKAKVASAKKVVDFGAGFGLSKAVFPKVITYEPYPALGTEATIQSGTGYPSDWVGKGGEVDKLIVWKGLSAKKQMLATLEGSVDLVLCNFVLNVVSNKSVRDGIVRDIASLLKLDGEAYIIVRNKSEINGKEEDTHEDGFLMNKGKNSETFQKGFTQEELLGYVRGLLPEDVFSVEIPKPNYKPEKQPKVLIKRIKA